MPNYKEMYEILFHAQTEAIRVLQEAQLCAEEVYVNEPTEDEESGIKSANGT